MKNIYLLAVSAILLSSTESVGEKHRKGINEFKENGGRI